MTELVILIGLAFGALAGYSFVFALARRRHSWPRSYRLAFAFPLAFVGAFLGFKEEFSILASSCLGYLIGLALGSVLVTTVVDEFFELGERELPFRLFLVVWSPALVGGLVGGLYNEIMHGSPLFIALLKIAAALSGSSVCTFLWLFVIQAVDSHIARRLPLER